MTVWLSTGSIIGESLIGFIVKTKLSESTKSPSDTTTLTETEPLKSGLGVTVKLAPSTLTEAFPSEDAEYVNSSPSTSLADKIKDKLPSSSITWSETVSNTGASLIEITVKLKLCSAKNSPSNALAVIETSPCQFKFGTIVIELLPYEISTFPECSEPSIK